MRKDHRPYYLKKIQRRWQDAYTRRFLRPHFHRLGTGFSCLRPWYVRLFGTPITMGAYGTIIAAADARVRLNIWSTRERPAGIHIGRYTILCPGVRISSAAAIRIGDNCMLAHGVYVTDTDWHDAYNRVAPGRAAPVVIEDNVWIGDGAMVLKGVTIGANSIVGARSVVVHGVAPNTVVAGNPARVVSRLDATQTMTTRRHWFADPERLYRDIEILERQALHGNTLWGWLRVLLAPRKGD